MRPPSSTHAAHTSQSLILFVMYSRCATMAPAAGCRSAMCAKLSTSDPSTVLVRATAANACRSTMTTALARRSAAPDHHHAVVRRLRARPPSAVTGVAFAGAAVAEPDELASAFEPLPRALARRFPAGGDAIGVSSTS
jgi:hypothetical protein